MTKDNSTGKDKDFYELGKKMFDRLKPFMPSAPAAGHQCKPQPVQPVNDKLLQIIAATYQILGAYDAPEHVLDVLADPEGATQAQIDALLPFVQPVQRPWVGLTEDEATDLWENTHNSDSWELIKRVEAKLKEKNT